jgi:hypothetical protein
MQNRFFGINYHKKIENIILNSITQKKDHYYYIIKEFIGMGNIEKMEDL